MELYLYIREILKRPNTNNILLSLLKYIPINLLPYNCKSINNTKDPILDGIVPKNNKTYRYFPYTQWYCHIQIPFKLLLYKYNWFMLVNDPILDGIVPKFIQISICVF